jgi:peptide/nickel transport system substrate-binding protein
MLNAIAAAPNATVESQALLPIEKFVAGNLPIIPTVYGAAFMEANASQITGWPSPSNPYESGSPNAPTNEVVVLHLK